MTERQSRSVSLGIIVFMIATSCFGVEEAKKDVPDVKAELDRLQGEWVLTAYETHDRYLDSFVMPSTFDGTMMIKGDIVEYSLLLQGYKEEYTFRLTLDPTTNPKHYDEIHPNGDTIKGIYELAGDTLKQCTTLDDGPRTHSLENGQLYIWKRKKSQTEDKDCCSESSLRSRPSEQLKESQGSKKATRAGGEDRREKTAEVEADLGRHQGEWVLKAWEIRDACSRSVIPPDTFEGQLKINGDAAEASGRIQRDEMKSSYRLQLDPTKTPKEFDAIMPDGGIIKGVYEFDGDSLKRCSGKLNGPRPLNFDAGTYHVWKRRRPQEGGRDIAPKKVVSDSTEGVKEKSAAERGSVK